MCNLYRMSQSVDEVAHFFADLAQDLSATSRTNAPEMVYPGYPGMVLAQGALQQMVWGFPLAQRGAKGQMLKPRPVNNARADKLQGAFWSAAFQARRCLIPVSAFAEAEGQRGRMTRTWFSPPADPPHIPLFAMAGLWRDTAEWGRAYTMVMTSSNEWVRPVHDRMPVILPREAWETWLEGDAADALGLCRPYAGAMAVDRTDEPWANRR